MDADDVRELARSAIDRWTEIDMVHRSQHDAFEVNLRHGVVEWKDLRTGHRFREVGNPPSSHFRPVEPYPTNYEWCAMLDPAELSHHVRLNEVEEGELSGRPVVRFVAYAEPGYDPICGCCPLVYSEVSERGEQPDGWEPEPGQFPDGVELSLDLQTGIVVSSRDRGGRLGEWLTNEITRAV